MTITSILRNAILLLCWAVVPSLAQPAIRFVDKDATGTPIDGTTWSRAYRTLQAALDNVPPSGTTQIWVAEGTYRPSKQAVTGVPRSVTFTMKNALEIYGGFAGTEALTPISPTNDPRTPGHETILDGGFAMDCEWDGLQV
ncbi:MAG: hypothetical protein HOP29_18435 [Phycisphaerales bacterium]|nr:hypothetical protein [Phycisphaerales bacterium]